MVVVVGAFFWQTSPCCRCGTGGSGARVFGQRSCVSCRWLALNGKRGKHVSVSAWGSLKCACLRGVRGGVQVLFPSHPSSHCRGLVPASWLLFPVAKALSSAAPPPPPPPAAALGPTMRAQPHPQVAWAGAARGETRGHVKASLETQAPKSASFCKEVDKAGAENKLGWSSRENIEGNL